MSNCVWPSSHGATIHLDERLLEFRTVQGKVDIVTDRRTIQAARVVLAAGPWLPTLAGGRLQTAAKVYRQTLHWFAADAALFTPGRFPVFIWMHGEQEEDYFYGFPTLPGSAAVKVATERYVSAVNPDTVSRDVDASEARSMFDSHVSGRLRGVTQTVVRSAACLYTVTPDAGFILDVLPEHPERHRRVGLLRSRFQAFRGRG